MMTGRLEQSAVEAMMESGDAWASFVLLGGFAYFDANFCIMQWDCD